ncbi:MAG: tRNA (adenosine(37)-N6)-threonylcarbamoyltransferase complex dimerization subunit type 1 TsaB [Burkholderiaceae bacterium]
MRILAIETSGDWCGIAVGDGVQWHVREEQAGQSHSERALVLAQLALADAEWTLASLDGIAFGAGPGSFTGVRIACGLAQGLAFGAGLPVVAIPTLASLAHAVWRSTGRKKIFACLDARMREVYAAAYARNDDDWLEMAAPAVLPPSALVPIEGEGWFGAGNGFDLEAGLVTQLGLAGAEATARPTARAVGELALPRLEAGEGVTAAAARPLYVRHRIALTTAERDAGVRL